MKKIKSYTGIWNVEKVLYAINDFNLPFPVTFTQISWFVITEFIIILFGDLPPLSMIEGAFLKYFGIPVALTWFMSQKTFDGKKPYSFIKSQIAYALRPKVTYAGKAVKLQRQTMFELVSNFEGKYPQNKNEIAVTDAFFTSESKSPKLNSKVKLNINGRTEEFIVVGILLDENTTTFPIFVSKSKCQELRGNDLLNGYVWLENADTLSKDEATEILSQISENTGLNNWTISGYYDYVNAQISFSKGTNGACD